MWQVYLMIKTLPSLDDLIWEQTVCKQGPVVTIVSPIADPEVVSLIPAPRHTFMEIDHEICSTAIFLNLLFHWDVKPQTKHTKTVCKGYPHTSKDVCGSGKELNSCYFLDQCMSHIIDVSRDMRFPTMWHFDMNRV